MNEDNIGHFNIFLIELLGDMVKIVFNCTQIHISIIFVMSNDNM